MVQRYDYDALEGMQETEDGSWILYSDYAHLEAENAKTIQFHLKHTNEKNKQIAALTAECERLRGELGEIAERVSMTGEDARDLREIAQAALREGEKHD